VESEEKENRRRVDRQLSRYAGNEESGRKDGEEEKLHCGSNQTRTGENKKKRDFLVQRLRGKPTTTKEGEN
jgi:hypothetical protein